MATDVENEPTARLRLWPELEAALAEVTDRCARVPDEGSLGRAIRLALHPPGKLLRPAVLLAVMDLLGSDLAPAVPAAAGLELCHVASLVHDDLVDGDKIRRGHPSVHAAHGPDMALFVGDALLFGAFDWMDESIRRGAEPHTVASAASALARNGPSAGIFIAFAASEP